MFITFSNLKSLSDLTLDLIIYCGSKEVKILLYHSFLKFWERLFQYNSFPLIFYAFHFAHLKKAP